MDTDLLRILARSLPRGREHATSVPDLCARLGVSDRVLREGLEQLVNGELGHRVAVVTLPTSPGVFVAATPAELDLADAHLHSKALALLKRRRSLRLCRAELEHQYTGTLF